MFSPSIFYSTEMISKLFSRCMSSKSIIAAYGTFLMVEIYFEEQINRSLDESCAFRLLTGF